MFESEIPKMILRQYITHKQMHTHLHTYTYTCMNAHMHTHTYVHTHTHIHSHTYMHADNHMLAGYTASVSSIKSTPHIYQTHYTNTTDCWNGVQPHVMGAIGDMKGRPI